MKYQQKQEKKKKPRHIILRIINFIIVLSLLVLINAFRTRLSAEEFTFRMEEAGFKVEKKTNSLEKAEAYLVADNGTLYVEFMVYETTSEARNAFSEIRSELEALGDIVAFMWDTSGLNSGYEQRTSNKQYARVSRIGNSILLINTTTEYENNVVEIWKMLGQ